MAFGFITELSVTKVAEVGFSKERARVLIERYPHAEEKIIAARRGHRALWRYDSPLIFISEIVGRVECQANDLTDFASVPRIPIVYAVAGDTAHASAGIHDELCHAWIDEGRIGWRTAADVFREAMKHEGVPAWRRALMHWAVVQADPESKWEGA